MTEAKKEVNQVIALYDNPESYLVQEAKKEGRALISFNNQVPHWRSRKDAQGALANQKNFLEGNPCKHPETIYNGLGRYECCTCGRFFVQQANGHVPGLS